MTGGTMLGPLLGGVVYDHGGYYAVFAMAFALIGLDIVLRIVMIEKKVARRYEPQAGQGLMSSAAEGAETNQNEDNAAGNQLVETPKRRHIPPVIWLLSSRRLLVALFASMVFGVKITGFDAVLPLFVQATFGWTSTGGGLIFLAIFVPSLFSPWIGSLVDRHGPKFFAGAGFIFSLPFYVLLRLVTHNSISQKVLLCALLVLIGIGIALVNSPVFTEIIHIVHAKERQEPGIFGSGGATAQAYGLFNLAFAAGTIVGPVYAGFILDAAGWATMGWSLGLLTGVTSVPVFLLTGGWVGSRRQRKHNGVSLQEVVSHASIDVR